MQITILIYKTHNFMYSNMVKPWNTFKRKEIKKQDECEWA